jgi:predicted RNase H-like HicB family nuclease
MMPPISRRQPTAQRTPSPAQGETIEEAIANLREATEVYLEEFPLQPVGQPLVTTFQVAEHA